MALHDDGGCCFGGDGDGDVLAMVMVMGEGENQMVGWECGGGK